MVNSEAIETAKEHFGNVLQQQLERVERLKQEPDWTDYSAISPIIVGMLGGDGIGPTISTETQRVLEYLLRDPVSSGKVPVSSNRRAHHRKPCSKDAINTGRCA